MIASRGRAPLAPTNRLRHSSALMTACCVAALFALNTSARAATAIDTAQPFYLASQLGSAVNPDFQGGTLRIDTAAPAIGSDFTVEAYPTNTIDAFGNSATFSGSFSGAGPLTFTDSVGTGKTTLTGTSSYTGTTTISAGTLAITGTGAIAASSSVIDNGTVDISGVTYLIEFNSLAGSGGPDPGARDHHFDECRRTVFPATSRAPAI